MMGHKNRSKIYSFCVYIPIILALIFLAHSKAVGNDSPSKTDPNDVQQWLAELEKRTPAPVEKNNSAPVEGFSSVRPSKGTGAKDKGVAWGPGYRDVQKISVDFYKVDLHNVFRLLSKVSQKNFVVDEAVSGTLTLSLQDVPWTFVLDVIKNLKDLSSIERYNTIMIYPSSKKVTWAGEAGDTGTLAFEPREPQAKMSISSESKLKIKTNQEEQQTPVEQIFKAEKFIGQASEAERKGNISSALDLYKKASDLWLENISLAKKIASLALGKGKDELTALNYARRALKYAPKDSEAATLAAVALARMGKNRQARAYFERALAGDKVSMDTLYNYAVFCFSQGEYRQVLRLILRMEKGYPLTPDIMMLRARSYEAMKDNYRAINEYRALINAGKSVPANLRLYAQERIEILSSDGGDHESAPKSIQ